MDGIAALVMVAWTFASSWWKSQNSGSPAGDPTRTIPLFDFAALVEPTTAAAATTTTTTTTTPEDFFVPVAFWIVSLVLLCAFFSGFFTRLGCFDLSVLDAPMLQAAEVKRRENIKFKYDVKMRLFRLQRTKRTLQLSAALRDPVIRHAILLVKQSKMENRDLVRVLARLDDQLSAVIIDRHQVLRENEQLGAVRNELVEEKGNLATKTKDLQQQCTTLDEECNGLVNANRALEQRLADLQHAHDTVVQQNSQLSSARLELEERHSVLLDAHHLLERALEAAEAQRPAALDDDSSSHGDVSEVSACPAEPDAHQQHDQVAVVGPSDLAVVDEELRAASSQAVNDTTAEVDDTAAQSGVEPAELLHTQQDDVYAAADVSSVSLAGVEDTPQPEPASPLADGVPDVGSDAGHSSQADPDSTTASSEASSFRRVRDRANKLTRAEQNKLRDMRKQVAALMLDIRCFEEWWCSDDNCIDDRNYGFARTEEQLEELQLRWEGYWTVARILDLDKVVILPVDPNRACEESQDGD